MKLKEIGDTITFRSDLTLEKIHEIDKKCFGAEIKYPRGTIDILWDNEILSRLGTKNVISDIYEEEGPHKPCYGFEGVSLKFPYLLFKEHYSQQIILFEDD